MKKNLKKGFTLAELLIVVAIIAVLVAIGIPIFNGQLEKSREAYDIYTMRQAASAAIDLYYAGVNNSASASENGLKWWSAGNTSNAYGVYNPENGTFSAIEPQQATPYGKGTSTDGGTSFVLGNDRGAYGSKEDYTDAVIMIAIYPLSSDKRVDVYWKNTKHKSGNTSYVGGAVGKDDPTYSIRIFLD
ncbi:MAG: prepilin-type N-terminal cleavage/methylation domain-containing protein [Erysipelotrichaceae bacterium]|nr:prepilin-type N-terminal cleavage/methylation domain-containing protein [Erysipelotrichaceae bacterium]